MLRPTCYGVGIAAHNSFNDAARNAYHELLTFDRVFCHHYSKSRFQAIPLDVLDFKGFCGEEIQGRLNRGNLTLTLYQLRPASDAYVVIALIQNKIKNCVSGFAVGPLRIHAGNWAHSILGFLGKRLKNNEVDGVVCGFGSSTSLRAAAIHAGFECIREAVAVLIGGAVVDTPISTLEEKKDPQWHFVMAQKTEFDCFLKQNLLPVVNEATILTVEDIKYEDVTFERLEEIHKVFPGMPLVVVRAYSERLMLPQFGHPVFDPLTKARLERFSGGAVDLSQKIPHFYG
jgi:hypothetical protein